MSKSKAAGYEAMMVSFRRACHRELEGIIADLPICVGDRVLDVGCGDGQYAEWLAERVVPSGQVVGVDIYPAFLQLARARLAKSPFRRHLEFVQGRVPGLPFPDGLFDLVWCGQSLFSMPDTVVTLREMARVVRPGGIVAVLEEDTLHQILLSWPISLELPVRQAEYRAFSRESETPEKYYMGRELRGKFLQVGLRPQRRRTYALSREAPLNLDDRRFVDAHLKNLYQRAKPFLTATSRRLFRPALDPHSRQYLPARQDFSLSCIEHVMWGKKD